MNEPSSERPAGSGSATASQRGQRRRRRQDGYFIPECGHRVPLVELGPGGYWIGPCREGCDDLPQ
ncbi:MAG: hypothetical protein ACRDQU_01580 [Pseudonocardiaceae bacterium]